MRTKKQVEQKALSLYPILESMSFTNEAVVRGKRKAYLQCWKDMNKAPDLKYLNVNVKGINSDQSL